MHLEGKVHDVKIPCLQTTDCSSVIHFFQGDISIHTSVVVNILGAGLEVLRAMRIRIVVCVRTPCSLVHGYECFWGDCCVSSQAI